MTQSPPGVLTRSVRYQPDAGRLLQHLAAQDLVATVADGSRPLDAVLLESVDIATKASRTTIAVLEASARLTCHGQNVVAQALPQAPDDGRACLERLRRELADHVTGSGPTRLSLAFPRVADDDGLEERTRLTAVSSLTPLSVLARAQIDHPHLPLEVGALAFDYLAAFESLPEVGDGANTCPDYLFYDARIILVVDHPTATATLVGASMDVGQLATRMEALARAVDAFDSGAAHRPEVPGTGPDRVVHAVPTQSDADFAAVVEQMKEEIAAGEVYQVVPSRGFTLPCPDALAAYHRLRESNPSPYMFYVAAPDFELLGASPESALLHAASTGEIAIRPIAGTRPRGMDDEGRIDHELDTRLELELRTDAKEVAEHVMLVDLARNDVARVSLPGTRTVRDLLRVDRYSRVMHLVSEVSGTLDPDLTPLDALRASMTMGTLTGAPKLRAAELIRRAEGVRRGSYGGSVGYLRGDGELDTCIVIRSAFVCDGLALVQAGAGVVADSVPDAEAAETVHKASAVLAAVAAAQGARLIIDSAPGAAPGGQGSVAPAGTTTSQEA